jgi:hypothetical protein
MRAIAILTPLVLPAMAVAHNGPHMPPHGIDIVSIVAAASAALAVGVLIRQGSR